MLIAVIFAKLTLGRRVVIEILMLMKEKQDLDGKLVAYMIYLIAKAQDEIFMNQVQVKNLENR